MLDRTLLDRLDGYFGGVRSACVAVHQHPDGDALGSASALVSYLRERRVCDAVAIVPDPYPATLDFLVRNGEVIVASKDQSGAARALAACDLLVCLDLNSPGRTGTLETAIRSAHCPKVMIDHHPGPDADGFDLVFSETEISSASELLYSILMEMPDVAGDARRLPKDTALGLMTGMTTDTNNFANSTYPSTFVMASRLIEAGVDRDRLLSLLYNRYRENRFRAMGYYLQTRLRITPDGVAYAVFSAEDFRSLGLGEGETEGFVNLPLGIDRVRMSIFLREDGDIYRVSVRSRKGWSSNALARAFFNGGGHECAAGGRLRIADGLSAREDAEKYIEDVTARFLQDEALSL